MRYEMAFGQTIFECKVKSQLGRKFFAVDVLDLAVWEMRKSFLRDWRYDDSALSALVMKQGYSDEITQ